MLKHQVLPTKRVGMLHKYNMYNVHATDCKTLQQLLLLVKFFIGT